MSDKWQRIRALMTAALDLCETVERLGPTRDELARPLNPAEPTGPRLSDVLEGARSLPLQAGNDMPGINESDPAAVAMARALVAVAALAGRAASATEDDAAEVDRVTNWLRRVGPELEGALTRGRSN